MIYGCFTSKTEAEIAMLELSEDIKPKAIIREVSAAEQMVTLKSAKHNNSFNAIASSFSDNFELLNDCLKKLKSASLTQAEIAGTALQKYNELQQWVREFDKIQENTHSEFYAKLLLAANKHLLALYLLSIAGVGDNFESVLNNCICSIMFARVELS